MDYDPTFSPINSIRQLKELVLDSLISSESKRSYRRGIDTFLDWLDINYGSSGFTKAAVQRYRTHLIESGLSGSTIAVYLTAVRRLAAEAADQNVLDEQVAGAIGRIRGLRHQGTRIGNWLTLTQAEAFINSPDTGTVKGKRDRALLGILIGCGLRRKEASCLEVEQIQQREGRWVIVDLIGKGGKIRSLSVPGWTKDAINLWLEAAKIASGRVFRPVNLADRVAGEKMTAQAVFVAVKRYSDRLGLKIAPHDCRRSYARLSYKGGASLSQIQISLAHSSVQTTEKYVGVQQDFVDAPCDHLGLHFPQQPIESID